MDQRVSSLWPGQLVGGSVVGGFIKTGKNVFGIVISPLHIGQGLFSNSNFIFFYIEDKEETSLIVRSSHSNL